MRVLIVEDSDQKGKNVAASLRRALPNDSLEICEARSFISAMRCLEQQHFDLLILDLVLPIRDGDVPNLDGGRNVLSEVLVGSNCIRPSHIICLTAFDTAAKTLRTEREKNLVHIVIYNETDTQWREALEAKAKYVDARLRDAETRPTTYKIDVGIVTSSPLVELREVTRLPGALVGEHNQLDALDYYGATWQRTDGRDLSVVACAAPRIGMTAACVTASKMIDRWRPKFLVMTGIAAASQSDYMLGDILVAGSAYDYGSGKIVQPTTGGRRFIPSPHPLHVDADLQPILQRWEREQLRTSEIQRAWPSEMRTTPKLIIGILATGAAVVQSEDLVREILSNSRKVVGLDMEAYAVFQAAQLASLPRPRVLVAKSVSDFAGTDKNDDFQQYAAFTSARFVFEFFTNACELELGSV
jgi:nucleoside phosphorylase